VFVLAAALAVQAGGTAKVESFYSAALGQYRSVLVYVPEGYVPVGPELPVVYYLHGAGGQPGAWYLTDYFPVLDDLIADGIVDPAIFVEPDSVSCLAPQEWQAQGVTGRLWTFHMNSDLLGNNEDYLAEDLVAWVDATYRTAPNREHRFIVARSFGGHGAMRLTMRHPETFGGASIDAGFMEILDDQVMSKLAYVRALTPGPPYEFSPLNDSYSMAVFNFCAAFTANMTNPPWYVDFLLDEDGEVDQGVFQQLAAQSPTALVADYASSAPDYPMDLFLRVGDHDEFADTFWPVIDALETNGVPHLLRVFEGSHWVPDDVSKIAVQMSYFMPIKATAEVSPRVADPRLYPQRLRVAVELPGGLDVADIDCTTLALIDIDGSRLDCPVGCSAACEISDVNGNGRDDLSVWLSSDRLARAATAAGAAAGDEIRLTIRGELDDGRFFQATDTVTLAIEPNAVAAVD
jgi:S-formylglutathione hydrolase FrmB